MSLKIRQPAKAPSPGLPGLFLRLLVLAAVGVVLAASPAAASPDAVRWTKVNIPAGGETGGWVLASGSDVRHLTASPDGTLYAAAPGLTYTLYRSADGGYTWTHLGKVGDDIVAIAVSPADESRIYYATVAAVFRSTDAGKTFSQLPNGPGGAGAGNVEITSLAVARADHDIVAVGTRDTDSSQFGGVYALDGADIIPAWTDTGLGSYDVYAVAFSPAYPTDRQMVAVMTDEVDSFVAGRVADGGWGAAMGNARLNRDNASSPVAVVVTESAAVAFPANYDADPASGLNFLYVAVATGAGTGDVYRISGAPAPNPSPATDLNAGAAYGQGNLDITGLAVYGEYPSAVLLAGAADSTRTCLSTDGGNSWTGSRKAPSGQSRTYLAVAPDFGTTGRVLAATGGGGSAFSVSRDIGSTWDQLGLIDTGITSIIDLAPSPDYGHDSTLFLLTFGSGHSLWRSRDGGGHWERVLTSDLAGVDSLSLVGLPPHYGPDLPTVFVAGESDGTPTVWESVDDGRSYRRRFTRDPATGNSFSIDAWAVPDERTLVVLSYDGGHGLVYITASSGLSYTGGTLAGSLPLQSLVLSPAYATDGAMLMGSTGGWVYLSRDGGASVEPLPGDAASAPFSGAVTVAFDPAFTVNRTVYAADAAADGGIWRFVIGTSLDWESIDGALPAGATLNQLLVAGAGTLYAANSDPDGGLERSLDPSFSLGPAFETVTRGLGDGAALTGLWQSGGRLWSVDTAGPRLLTFNDPLTAAVVPVSPADGTSGSGSLVDSTIRNVTLDWETLDGATSYKWQCDYDTDFSSVPAGFEGTTSASSARLPSLEPATTYYWRVRASAPVLGPWSEKWTFTTSLDTEVVALKPESPAAGASGVPVRPVFQWTAIAGADSYELLVATDADFSRPAIVKAGEFALPTNAWECDVGLDYATTYYWKVRALSAGNRSPWSAAGAFTTASFPPLTPPEPPAGITSRTPLPRETIPALAPSPKLTPLPAASPPVAVKPTPPPPPSRSDAPVPVPGPGLDTLSWLIYLIGGLLLTVILALIVILTIVLKIRHF